VDLGSAHGRIEFLYDPAGVARAQADLAGLSQAGGNIGDQMTKVGGAMLGIGGAISAGVGIATNVAADFEQQLANIASVGGKEAVARMDEISDVALQLGADTSFSAMEAAAGMEEMIKAGLPLSDILDGAAASALELSAATGTSVPESAALMSTALNVFSDSMTGFATEGEKATHIADLFTQAANASATDVHEMGLAFSQTATVADLFGVSIDDTATALAILADNGIKSSDAGTGLKQMFLSLTRQTKPAKEALESIGLTFDDFVDSAGQFVGIEPMFETLRTAMEASGKTAFETNDILAQIFGQDAIRAAGIFFQTNETGWNRMRDDMEKVGTAQEQAAIRMDTFKGAIERLHGSVETALIAFGTPLLGGMRKTTEGITELVNAFINLDPNVQAAVARTVALTGTLLGLGGTALIVGGQFVKLAQALGLSQAAALRLVGAFGVLAGLAGLAIGAYVTNFLGFRDTVNALAGEVLSFGKTFSDTFAKKKAAGMNSIAAGLAAIGEGLFWTENPVLMQLGEIFDEGAVAAQQFGDTFKALTDQGVSPAVAGLTALSFALDEIDMEGAADAVENLATSAARFGDIFEQSGQQAREAGFGGVADEIAAFGAALSEVTGLPVEEPLRRVAEVVQDMQDAFSRASELGLGPFQSAMEAVKVGIENITNIDVSGFSNRLGDLIGTIRDVGASFIQGRVIQGFDQLGTAIRNLSDDLGPEIQQGLQSIANTITSIDLGRIAIDVAGWIQGKWADLQSFIETEVLGRIPTVNLGTVAAEVTGWAITALEFIGDKIRELATGDDGDQRHAPGGGIDLGTVVATITGWLVEQGENLVTVIQTTVDRAKTALGGAGALIGQVTATIQSWLVEQYLPLVSEIASQGLEFAANAIVNIPQVTANIVSWLVEGVGNLISAIQGAVSGGGRGQGALGNLGGASGLSVTIAGVIATISNFVPDAAAAISTLPGLIKTAIGKISVPSITVTIAEIAWDVATAVANGLVQLAKDVGAAVKGQTVTVTDTVNITVAKTTIDEDGTAEQNVLTQFDSWVDGIVAEMNKTLEQVAGSPEVAALDFIDLFGNLGTNINEGIGPAFEAIVFTIIEGGGNMLEEIDNFQRDIGPHIEAIQTPFAAIPGIFALAGANFALAVAGIDLDIHKGADTVRAAFEDFMNVLQGKTGGSSQAAKSPFTTGAGDMETEVERIIGSMQQMGEDFAAGAQEFGLLVQGAFDDIATFAGDMTNPFEPVIEQAQIWIDEMRQNFAQLLGQGEQIGPGGEGLGGGIATKLANQVREMFDGIGPAVEAALPDSNPFQPAIDKLTEWWSQITSFDFFGLKPQEASAAAGTGGAQFDASTFGEEMGTQLASTFSSDEFINGVELGLENVATEQFTGVGTALMNKIQEGLSLALTAASRPAGVSETTDAGTLSGDMAATLQSIFTGIIQSLTTAAQSLDVGLFAPVGQALMAKIQEGLSSSLSANSTGGPGERGEAGTLSGGSLGTGLVQAVIGDIQSAIAAADFSAISTSFSQALSTNITTSLTGMQQSIATVMQGITSLIQAQVGVWQTSFASNMQTITSIVTAQTGIWNTTFVANMQAITSLITAQVGVWNTTVATQMQAITSLIQSQANVWQTTFATVMQEITNLIQAQAGVWTTTLNTFATDAGTAGTNAGQGFSTGIDTGMQAATSTVTTFTQQIVAILNGAAATAEAAGNALGQGFANGIAAMEGAVTAAATTLANAASNAITSVLSILSPSKVTFSHGQDTGQGLADGIRSKVGEVIAAVHEIIAQALAAIQDRLTGAAAPAAGEFITNMASTIGAGAPVVAAETNSLGDTIRQHVAGIMEDVGQRITEATSGIRDRVSAAMKEIGSSAMESTTEGVKETSGELTAELEKTASSLVQALDEFEMHGKTPGRVQDIADSMQELIDRGDLTADAVIGAADELRAFNTEKPSKEIDFLVGEFEGLADSMIKNSQDMCDNMPTDCIEGLASSVEGLSKDAIQQTEQLIGALKSVGGPNTPQEITDITSSLEGLISSGELSVDALIGVADQLRAIGTGSASKEITFLGEQFADLANSIIETGDTAGTGFSDSFGKGVKGSFKSVSKETISGVEKLTQALKAIGGANTPPEILEITTALEEMTASGTVSIDTIIGTADQLRALATSIPEYASQLDYLSDRFLALADQAGVAGTNSGTGFGTGFTDSVNLVGPDMINTTSLIIDESAGQAIQTATTGGTGIGDAMIQSTIAQMRLGGDGIAAEAIRSILSAVGPAQDAGFDIGTGSVSGIIDGMNSGGPEAVKAAGSLGDQIRAEIEAKLAGIMALDDSWTKEAENIKGDYSIKESKSSSNHIVIDVPLILEGEVLDERIIEVSIGGMVQTSGRNPLTKRRR
jgi:TP901 family phage tail tape measure protein